jgi:tRNA(Ile)-lysidine synthase
VLKTISRYSMLTPAGRRAAPARIAVAVSGGPDSVCLLHVLRELAPQLGMALSVVHFNHQLRGAASNEDERFVAQMAASFKLPFHRAEGNVAAQKGNLEQAARHARRTFFLELLSGGLADRIALGHTRDDQAETVLFRLLRGSGLAGLAGIYPVTAEGLIRPLIDVTRPEVEEFLRSRKIPWREDATNRDSRFARNRIRHGLLPQLSTEWNPRISEALAHLADLAHEEERWWSTELAHLAPGVIRDTAGGVEASTDALNQLPRAILRRLIRAAIGRVKGDLRQIDFRHVEAVADLAAQASGEGRLRLPGIEVTRSFDWICMALPGPGAAVPLVQAEVPGVYPSPDSAGEIHLEIAGKRPARVCATLKADLCWSRVPAPLELRGWRPGDHYRPFGRNRDQKVKDMFQRARVPSWRRQSWPILTGGGKILWAKGFGVAAEFAPGDQVGPILRVWQSEKADL